MHNSLQGGLTWFVDSDADHRDQRDSNVPHFSQQSVKCGLIDDGARQSGVSVAFLCDLHSEEIVCPLGAKMTLEPDLVDRGGCVAAW